MKKILASLMVLALCVPAMAATITVENGTGDDAGKAIVTIDSTGDAVNMVGLGLNVNLDVGTVTDVEIVTGNFNIYPDFANDEELNGDGYTYGEGHPVADQSDTPGPLGLPQQNFALSFGNLNGETVAGATGSDTVVVKLTVSQSATVEVCENAPRGGIVAVAGVALDAACDSELITVGPGDCIDTGSAWWADWDAFGKPDCWCYERNCEGDADGKSVGTKLKGYAYVQTDDLNVLLSGWNVKEPPKGDGIATITGPNGEAGICADFARNQVGTKLKGYARVETSDLNVLLLNWNEKEPPKGDGVPLCPLVGAGGHIVEYKYPAP